MTRNARTDLRPEEYEHELGYLFKPGPKTQKRRRMIRLFLKQNGKCFYCGEDMNPYWHDAEPMSWTIDHVIPRIRKPPCIGENYVASCKGCNERKDRLTAEEYLQVA
jgi:5-methylcytosine-specific restriction endonuclease McrA